MRISGGQFKGRNLEVPKGDLVRPTQDMVREALFSILMNEIPDATFLDLFAGSGSVALEALSRGAKSVTMVEMEPKHLAVIKRNCEMIKVLPETIRADVYSWIATAGRGRKFDICYADPPYALGAEKGYLEVLKTLAAGDVVREGGVFVAEMKADQHPDECEGWNLCKDRRYGQTRLAVYVRQ